MGVAVGSVLVGVFEGIFGVVDGETTTSIGVGVVGIGVGVFVVVGRKLVGVGVSWDVGEGVIVGVGVTVKVGSGVIVGDRVIVGSMEGVGVRVISVSGSLPKVVVQYHQPFCPGMRAIPITCLSELPIFRLCPGELNHEVKALCALAYE